MFAHQSVLSNSTSATSTAVCLVDDDASVRKSIRRLLESAGFKVYAFSEPELFLTHLSRNPVVLVVLDIWMERITGIELLTHLSVQSPATRVIFITGFQDPAAERTMKQAGVFAFFYKPFDDEEFLRAVRSALTQSAGPWPGISEEG